MGSINETSSKALFGVAKALYSKYYLTNIRDGWGGGGVWVLMTSV